MADIFQSIKDGNVKAVRAALAENPSVGRARAESGETPLLLAKYYGKSEIVQVILDSGVEPNLFEAAALGFTDKLASLAKRAGGVDQFSPDGFTPLQLAAFFGHPEAVRALLSLGADAQPASRNNMGVTALHAGLAGRSADSRLQIGIALIENGADINARQAGGFTPLHEAAQNGDVEIARALLAKGADPDAATDKGQTPLSLAEENGHSELAAIIRAAMEAS